MKSKINILTPAVQLLVFTLCMPIFGQDSNWTGDSGIEYFDNGNWTDGVPNSNGIAGFHLPGTYQVNIPVVAEASQIFVTDGQPTFRGTGELNSQLVDVDGTTLTVTEAEMMLLTDNLQVGLGTGSGTLSITDKATISASNTTNFFGSSSILVDNAFFVSDTLNVGHGANASNGTFTANNGSRINSRIVRIGQNGPADSSAFISGQSTQWQNDAFLVVGEIGTGRLTVTGGAIVNSDSFITAGRQNGSTGEIVVQGNGSQLGSQNSSLIIGGNGTGLLNVSGNGAVYAVDMIVGNGSTAQFSNSDGTFQSDLEVSDGEITMTNGSNLTVNGTANIGSDTGNGIVTNDKSVFNAGSLNVDDGEFRLTNNAIANVGNSPHIGPNGTLCIEDSEFMFDAVDSPLTVEGTMQLAGTPVTLAGETILTPTSSTVITTQVTFSVLRYNGDEFIIDPGGDVAINQTFSGEGTFSGNGEVEFRGSASPGNDGTGEPHGRVTGRELVFQNGSAMIMSIAGPTAGIEHDQFVATNAALINGAVLFLVIDPTVNLDVGSEIEILRCNSSIAIVGSFADRPEGTTFSHSSGHEFRISYVGGDGNDVVLTVLDNPGVLLGDVNLDGVVSLLDVGPFVDRISTGVFQAEADCNQDGSVDLLDVGIFVDLLSG